MPSLKCIFMPFQTMKPLLIFCMALMMSVSCKKDEPTNPGIGIAEAQALKNVSYGTDPFQKMDIYLPAGRNISQTKVLILIHGGAWISGDKSEFDTVITALKPLLPDFAIFNVNYRLAALPNTNPWPTQLNDIDLAMSFINSKAIEYGINSSKIGIGGASAGAHLALLKGFHGNASVKAIADLFGPADMKALYYANSSYQMLFNSFLNGTPTSNPLAYTSASPLFLVNSNTPPTIIFHGTVDPIVPVSQSDSLSNRLNNAGVIHQYIKYNGEGHGWYGTNLIDTYTKLAAFIKQYVQ